MSIRLDPRRLGTLKHLAGEAGVRPGDLVRQWVEERIDASRTGAGGEGLGETVAGLAARVAALEAALGVAASEPAAQPPEPTLSAPELEPAPEEPDPVDAPAEPVEGIGDAAPPEAEPAAEPESQPRRRTRVSAGPSERVALHDEMIAVIREHGPMTAADLATAISERGRYAPPRSGKAIDAAMVSQRVSNPTYRSRFVRVDGRIGLAAEG